jgi:hypothetical protein
MIAETADTTSQINKIASRCNHTIRRSDRGFNCAGATGIFIAGVAIVKNWQHLVAASTSFAPNEPNRLLFELLEPGLDGPSETQYPDGAVWDKIQRIRPTKTS